MRIAALIAILFFFATPPAQACTVCDSDTSNQVREELKDNHLGLAIAATLSPFVLLAGVVTFVHHGTPSRRRR